MEYNELIPDSNYKFKEQNILYKLINFKNIQIFFIIVILILQIVITIILVEFRITLLELKNDTDNDLVYINKFKVIIDYVCKNYIEC